MCRTQLGWKVHKRKKVDKQKRQVSERRQAAADPGATWRTLVLVLASSCIVCNVTCTCPAPAPTANAQDTRHRAL